MSQVSKFLPPNYETNYSKLDGPTGPCMYPAIHVYIHSALYYITDKGRDIRLAQILYAGLYLATLALVFSCYRRANAPPWLLLPLILSKRLHSIFLLRLFNDCWASFFLWLSVYSATRQWWSLFVLAWTIGLGVKMTMLLPLPAVGAILVQGVGIDYAVLLAVMSCILTFGSAAPFMGQEEMPIYLKQAFDLGRQFLYKWTVNWKWLPEETFLDKSWAYSLLGIHAVALLAFLQYKWVRPSSDGLWHFVRKNLDYMDVDKAEQEEIASRMTPLFVMDVMLGSIVVGMACARSLHYQFFAYLGWVTPYIMWRAREHPLRVLSACVLQELAWLVYPSTAYSSGFVVAMLVFQTVRSWQNLPSSYPPTIRARKQKQEQ